MLPKAPSHLKHLYGFYALVAKIAKYRLRKKADGDVEETASPEQAKEIAAIKDEIQLRKEAIANQQVDYYLTDELFNFFKYLRVAARKRALEFVGHQDYKKLHTAAPKIALAYPMNSYIGLNVFAFEAKDATSDAQHYYYINTSGLMTPTADSKNHTATTADDDPSVNSEFETDLGEKRFKPVDYSEVKAAADDVLIVMISDKNPLFTPEALLSVLQWAYQHFNYVIIMPTGTLQVHSITLDRIIQELDREQKNRIDAVISGKAIPEEKVKNPQQALKKDQDEALRKEQQNVGKALEMAKKAGFIIYCDSPDKLVSKPNLKKLTQVNTKFDKFITALEQHGLVNEAKQMIIARKDFSLDQDLRKKLSSAMLIEAFDELNRLINAYTTSFLKRITIRQDAKTPRFRYFDYEKKPTTEQAKQYFTELLNSPEPQHKVALIVPWQAFTQKIEYHGRETIHKYVIVSVKAINTGYKVVKPLPAHHFLTTENPGKNQKKSTVAAAFFKKAKPCIAIPQLPPDFNDDRTPQTCKQKRRNSV